MLTTSRACAHSGDIPRSRGAAAGAQAWPPRAQPPPGRHQRRLPWPKGCAPGRRCPPAGTCASSHPVSARVRAALAVSSGRAAADLALAHYSIAFLQRSTAARQERQLFVWVTNRLPSRHHGATGKTQEAPGAVPCTVLPRRWEEPPRPLPNVWVLVCPGKTGGDSTL